MADDMGPAAAAVELAARRVPLPTALSEAARAMLAMPRPAQRRLSRAGRRRRLAPADRRPARRLGAGVRAPTRRG